MSDTKTEARELKPAAQNQEPPRGRPLTPADVGTVQLIPLELLHRSPYQVRREGDVTELAADIRAHGLVNPITVRKRAQNDGFEVVAGHRRWAAMKLVNPEGEAPCIVMECDDRTAEELLVAENFVRSDLSIMEQAETVALLTLHGRTAEECGRVCRRSVRWAHRMRAIGGLDSPWREFFHVAGLPYVDILAVARIPADLRAQAWDALLGYLADELSYTVHKGNKEDEKARDVFLATLKGAADDRARFLDFLVRSAPPGQLASPAEAFDLVEDWFDDGARGLPAFAGEHRVLDPAACPFDCGHECAGCARRSDRRPDLFDEGDPARTTPRCYDAACWARKVAEAKALEADEDAYAAADGAAAEPANVAGSTVDEAQPQAAASPDAPAEAPAGAPAKKPGPDMPEASFRSACGAAWAFARLLSGDKLEDLLPRLSHLDAGQVRTSGAYAILKAALPKFKRNRAGAAQALKRLHEEGLK